MTEMVERVARALSVADGMHPDAVSNDEDEVPVWKLYVKDAKAAIEAMRVPTPDMERAGFHANKFENKHNGEYGCPNVPSVEFPRDAFDRNLTKLANAEKLREWEASPRCMVARATIPAKPAWQAMIDAALQDKEQG